MQICEVDGLPANSCSTHGWCSLSFRFDPAEQRLVRHAEQAFGAYLASGARREDLPAAIALAKASRKIAQASPGASVSLGEDEVVQLVRALEFSLGTPDAEDTDLTHALLRRLQEPLVQA